MATAVMPLRRLEYAADVPVLGLLPSRVVMSAMTRNLAGPEHCATPAMVEYYARRAASGVGLILTEGTIVHPSGDGYRSVPRLFTERQSDSWRPVVQRVHEHGAKIFSQLWHCGRISHQDFLDGAPPVSSTDRAALGVNRQNGKPFGTPRRLRIEEMPGVRSMFVAAARRALDAGFDGVELHLGHGYLADQFFDARVNDRIDEYGGAIENRCRFSLELISEVLTACGPDRVMVRVSPSRFMNGLYDWPDLDAMLAYVVPELRKIGLRMLDVSCANADYFQTSGRVIRAIRPAWPHLLLGGASLSQEDAQAEIDAGLLDLVTYGRLLIANHDLVRRFRDAAPLRKFDSKMLDILE